MTKKIHFDFDIKAKENGNLIIAGFANANTIDRGKERIEPKGWKLENFKKNPVVLFNHGYDSAFGSLPIGKARKVEATDEGLFTEIEISNSKTEKISAVRDLIEEGILKTFSVGFDPMDHGKEDDVRIINGAELLEISVVPIPMNQDSTFSLLSKKMPTNRTKLARKWLSNYQKSICAEAIKSKKDQNKFKNLALVNIIVDKSKHSSSEDVKKLLTQFGYVTESVQENDVEWIFKQGESTHKDSICFELAEGIKAEAMGEKEEDEQQQEQEQEEANQKSPKEEIDSAIETWREEATACANNAEGNPPSWVADEAAWEKAKEAADQSYSREDAEKYYSVVSYLYLNKFGGSKKQPEEEKGRGTEEEEEKGCGDKEKEAKSAIPSGGEAVDQTSSPLLDLSKQTNVLLGTLITEVQKLNQHMEKFVAKPMQEGETINNSDKEESEEVSDTEESDTMEDDEEMKAAIAKIRKNQEDLNLKLKSFS